MSEFCLSIEWALMLGKSYTLRHMGDTGRNEARLLSNGLLFVPIRFDETFLANLRQISLSAFLAVFGIWASHESCPYSERLSFFPRCDYPYVAFFSSRVGNHKLMYLSLAGIRNANRILDCPHRIFCYLTSIGASWH